MSNKIYTIAEETNKCRGHGEYGATLCINQNPDGFFPPVFKTQEAAQQYLGSIKWNHDKKVVELDLCNDNSTDSNVYEALKNITNGLNEAAQNSDNPQLCWYGFVNYNDLLLLVNHLNSSNNTLDKSVK